jgi:tetratricopeptide (TPR) repeat protein
MASPALDLPQALNRAVAAYRAGQLAQAEDICGQIISVDRNFFDALYVLAVVQAGLGKNVEALANYDRALALQPRHAEALSNRGNTLKALKRFDEALDGFDKALAIQPDYPAALSNRGAVLFDMARYEEALATYDRSLALRPDQVIAFYNRGGTLHKLGRFEEAIASYDRAIALSPGLVEAHANRGNTLNALHRYDEALTSFDRALALRPDLIEALTNRGNALNGLKRYDDALASYDRVIAIQPAHASAHYNRGTTLHEMKRYDEAIAAYDRAIALQPHYPEAFSNRGATLWELKRHDAALASYDHAIAIQPDFPEAHWNAASLRLLTGDFERGWAEYEWRWKYNTMALASRNFTQPIWRGEALEGKTILLHSEQGLGDAIQFCRYVPLVAVRGARVILEVDKRLRDLMSSLDRTAQVLSAGEALPQFDVHCPLLSLPRAFHTLLETIPSRTPYLRASPERLAKWSARLGPKRGLRVGLIWSGNPAHHRDQVRSIEFSALVPLLDAEATFFSLQKDVRPADAAALASRKDVIQIADELADFSDTAAAMAQLDLIISVDTSTVHLAGALGRPVWILLPFLPDWRWLLDRDTSPWYPTARLFRQDETRRWDSVIPRVRAALLELIADTVEG